MTLRSLSNPKRRYSLALEIFLLAGICNLICGSGYSAVHIRRSLIAGLEVREAVKIEGELFGDKIDLGLGLRSLTAALMSGHD